MTRKWYPGRAIVLIFAVAAFTSNPVLAQTGEDSTHPAKSPAAPVSSADRGIGAGVVSGLLSHFMSPGVAAPSRRNATPPSEGPARIWLRVPRDAKVWFNDQETTLTGRHRRFVSPSLIPGKTYTYKIRVRWMKDGKAVMDERNIEFRAGESVPIDFTQPDDRVSANTTKEKVALSSGTAK
jgi:uncharacterized protein (TIGR03000 family)